ncbi:hypothetical protein AUQ48_16830 [Kocuria flava]|uniref:Uncharacterized protein n=1 Tax=Kocuria flava TaxID=446860 RepID=A0A2N4SXN9_9MICC|nr:hypothetical protein [Kocuria flava]PLC10719.1 hypothetical protein AUQ48_16830 [Kocuria flava]
MLDVQEAQQARALQHAMTRAGIPPSQLWWHYYSLSGDADELELEAYLYQALHLPRLERLMLDHALRELINDRPG